MNKARLSDVIEIISGGTPKTSVSEYWNGDIPWLSVVDFGDKNKFVSDTEKKITQAGVEHSSTTVLQPNDIIISARGTVGAMAMLTKPMAFNQSCFGLRAKPEIMDQDFLFYYLKSYMNNIKAKSQGSVFSTINLATFDNLEVQFPDLSQQKRISRMLSDIDNRIENNNCISSQLESLAKTIYDYWFLQFDFPDENGRPYKSSGGKMVWNEELKRDVPEGWKITSLKGQYSIERGISYTSDDIKSGQGIPMLNLACIDTSRNYRDGELKYIGRNVSENDKLHGGEMLIACTDLTRNADIVGCPILAPQDGQTYTYSMDLAKLNSTNPSITEAYLFETLRTDFYHNYIKKWASGTNVLHLNLDGLDWYSIVIPPLELQRRFSNILIPIEKKKNQLLVENRQLSSLRDFLLPMLMNGQVTFKEDA